MRKMTFVAEQCNDRLRVSTLGVTCDNVSSIVQYLLKRSSEACKNAA